MFFIEVLDPNNKQDQLKKSFPEYQGDLESLQLIPDENLEYDETKIEQLRAGVKSKERIVYWAEKKETVYIISHTKKDDKWYLHYKQKAKEKELVPLKFG